MSARPGDWSLLNLDGDPFPGDESAVSRQAGHYRTVADAISDQITNLRKISNGQAKGLYVDKLADSAKDLANDLSKVHNRFDTVATQLKVWQPALAEGRTKSAALLREAETAHSSMSSNKPPDKPLPHDATDAQKTAEKTRGKNYSSAQGELNGYVQQMHTELEHVRGIAKKVADKINDASDDGVKDSWWDRNVRKWIQDHAHLIDIIVKVLEVVAIVIAVVALVCITGGAALGALGFAGGALAGALETVAGIAEIAGAISSFGLFAGHVLERDAGVNNVSLWSIGLDVVALATFGAGRLLTKSTSRAAEALEASSLRSAATKAVTNLEPKVLNALKIRSATNPLRVWAEGQKAAAIANAQRGITDLLEGGTKASYLLRTGSYETAEALSKLRALGDVRIGALRVGTVISTVDRLHLSYHLSELPKTLRELRELIGGEGEGAGGEGEKGGG